MQVCKRYVGTWGQGGRDGGCQQDESTLEYASKELDILKLLPFHSLTHPACGLVSEGGQLDLVLRQCVLALVYWPRLRAHLPT